MTPFKKSSFCSIGDCVEVAQVAGAWRLRSTTDPGVELSFDHREWLAFISDIKDGVFDGGLRRP